MPHEAGVSLSIAERAGSLIRSLAGVQDARVDTRRDGRIIAVHIVPQPGMTSHRIVRNARSGLIAAFGVQLEASRFFVVQELPAERNAADETRRIAIDNAVPKSQPRAPQPTLPAIGTLTVAPSMRDTPQTRAIALDAARAQFDRYKPVPRVEVLEFERDESARLRCRVIIEAGGRRRSGTVSEADERTSPAELAACATVEAVRLVDNSDWLFDGMANVILAGQRHIVVSLRSMQRNHTVSGAAPVYESTEQAVANAVLNAAGFAAAATQQNGHSHNGHERLVAQR